MASQMSSMCTTGRHGLPSLIIAMRLVVQASARQVVEHDVEAHARRGAVRRRVAQEHRAEIAAGHRADVALDQRLAFGIGGLRIGGRGLVEEVAGARAVDAARGGVDEAADPGAAGGLGERYRALVVDLVGDRRVVLAQRIVRQLRQVRDRVAALEILGRDVAQVLVERARAARAGACCRCKASRRGSSPCRAPRTVRPALHEVRSRARRRCSRSPL